MKKHSVATIINFCTNEIRFIQETIEQALLFSKQIVIPFCDHFFNGKKENSALLDQVMRAFPECHFIQYPLVDKGINLHSLARFVATRELLSEIEYVLFLDADEIPDGQKFLQWLDGCNYKKFNVMKLANYWYFREPIFQAKVQEDSIVLAKKALLTKRMLFSDEERNAIYDSMEGPKERGVVQQEGLPMFHHYSWVRTEAEMLQKVRAWGHKADRNWDILVKEEFSRPFQGTDFVHGYAYQIVEAPFQIPEKIRPFQDRGKPNLRVLHKEEWGSFMQKRPFLDCIRRVWRFWNLIFSRF